MDTSELPGRPAFDTSLLCENSINQSIMDRGEKIIRGDEEDDQVVGIFNIIQKKNDTVVHLKVD